MVPNFKFFTISTKELPHRELGPATTGLTPTNEKNLFMYCYKLVILSADLKTRLRTCQSIVTNRKEEWKLGNAAGSVPPYHTALPN